ncbi:DUF1203 domain-containing protein [Aspergillus lucknowensis]|uniref:DUF1203 domain-containing protein n=1 Tax=Aspergillus lucknowensis TaxID=176173 RepID=A0ABR4LR58_9EURO
MKFTALPAPLTIDTPKSILKPVDATESYPCRRCLQDAEIGENVLLLSYDPFLGSSPYTAPGPIFVHHPACLPFRCDGSVPDQQARRVLSVRAYDAKHMMVDQGVVPGRELEGKAEEIFRDGNVEYIHVHYAGAGCFAVRIDR